MFGNKSNNVSTAKVVSKEIKKIFHQSVTLPEDLVTNDSIRETFIKLLKESNVIPSGPLKQIWRLVNEQMIIPVNVKKKGLLGWLNNILKNSIMPFAYSYDNGTMAFYSGSSNRIYLLIDNIQNAKIGTHWLGVTVIHELQHMQCHNFPSEFYNVHKKTINSFYYELFNVMCGQKLVVNSTSAQLFGRYLLYLYDDIFTSAGATITDNDFKAYHDRAATVYLDNNMKIPEYGFQIATALTMCAESMIDGKFFDRASKDSKSIERYFYRAVAETYRRIGWNPIKLNSFFGQECIAPSEIISLKPNITISNDLFAFLNRL